MNTWTALGPAGGYLCALAVAPSDPAVVYAAGSSLHRSADGGATWEPTGAAVGNVSCLLSVDAVDPLRLYALHSDRVERSLDGGTTWETTQSGISAASAQFPIAVSAADPAFLLFSDWDKIYRSLDRGDSWEEISALQWNLAGVDGDPSRKCPDGRLPSPSTPPFMSATTSARPGRPSAKACRAA